MEETSSKLFSDQQNHGEWKTMINIARRLMKDVITM